MTKTKYLFVFNHNSENLQHRFVTVTKVFVTVISMLLHTYIHFYDNFQRDSVSNYNQDIFENLKLQSQFLTAALYMYVIQQNLQEFVGVKLQLYEVVIIRCFFVVFLDTINLCSVWKLIRRHFKIEAQTHYRFDYSTPRYVSNIYLNIIGISKLNICQKR